MAPPYPIVKKNREKRLGDFYYLTRRVMVMIIIG